MDIYSYPVFLLLICVAVSSSRFKKPHQRETLILLANTAFLAFFPWQLGVAVASLVAYTFLSCRLASRAPQSGPILAAILILLALLGRSILSPSSFATPLNQSITALSLSFVTLPLLALLFETTKGTLPPPSLADAFRLGAFFPTAIAGPVLRPGDFFQNIRNSPPDGDATKFVVESFSLGLIKKAVVGDRLGLLFSDLNSTASAGGPGLLRWLALYVYAIEVYFDFSGYSDMARAVARSMGILAPENFFSPWLAESPVDFWRRWHQSLSNFLRDYVYYPVFFRWKNLYAAAFITFMLNGIWHGLSVRFLSLGLFWSFWICFYLLIRKWWDTHLPKNLRIFLTLQISAMSFLFFLPEPTKLFTDGRFLSGGTLDLTKRIDLENVAVMAFGLLSLFLAKRGFRSSRPLVYAHALAGSWLVVFLCGLLNFSTSFIYSQF